jgi:hypothetical protein
MQMQMVMVMMLAQCGRGQFQSVGLSIGNNRLSAGERSVLVMQRSVCCGKVRLLWQRWVGWQREQETNERFGLFRKLSRVRFDGPCGRRARNGSLIPGIV